MGSLAIAIDDPKAPDVASVLQEHLSYAKEGSLPGVGHAYGADRLSDSDIVFFTARRDGILLATGALLHIEPGHAEIKSMHTVSAVRGQGIGRAMLTHLIETAGDRGYERVSLETGMQEAFAAARSLYRKFGFEPCAPFGVYREEDDSLCMTRQIG